MGFLSSGLRNTIHGGPPVVNGSHVGPHLAEYMRYDLLVGRFILGQKDAGAE